MIKHVIITAMKILTTIPKPDTFLLQEQIPANNHTPKIAIPAPILIILPLLYFYGNMTYSSSIHPFKNTFAFSFISGEVPFCSQTRHHL